tara:strand:+ start:1123 stop:1785 length:663 start_codon:yes stop_codon:yes gene_type:complete
MTYLEKNIYNTHLKTFRSKQNLPYKFRKNFSNFQDTENYIYVKKLGIFFNKFPYIDIQTFFDAPYEMYSDGDPYELRFYVTPKATKMYGLYIKKLDNEEPDSDIQIEFIKTSLMNMFTFCRDNKLVLPEYLHHKTNNIHTFIMHIRERRSSLYVLLCLPEFDKIIGTYPNSQLDFTTGKKFQEELANYRTRLYNCRTVRTICEDGLDKITLLLNKLKKNI